MSDKNQNDDDCHSGFILKLSIACVIVYLVIGYWNSTGGGM